MDGVGLLLLVALAGLGWIGFSWHRRKEPGTIETGHGAAVATGTSGPEAEGALLPARWVRSGEVILLGHVPVHGGLVYFGHIFHNPPGSETIPGPRPDAAIIDPRFPVGGLGREENGFALTTPYGYDMMDRRQRRHFLLWLSGPREDGPGLDPGFVLIYFHGLERRLMVERPAADRVAVRAEVRRLATLFGGRPWFRDLPADLIHASEAAEGVPEVCPPPAPDLWAGGGLAPAALVHLGRRVAREGRLDAEGALLWLLADRSAAVRGVGARAFEAFRELFALRFRARWADGFPVPVPAERLRFHIYRASNDAFQTRFALGDGTVPDLRPVWEAMAPLRDLAESVAGALEPYVRFLARAPDRRDSAEARALLPPELRAAATAAASPTLAGRSEPPSPGAAAGAAPMAAADRRPPAAPAPSVPRSSAPPPFVAAPFVPPPVTGPVAPPPRPAASSGRTAGQAEALPPGLAAVLGGRTAGIVPLAAVLKGLTLAPTWPLPLAVLGGRMDQLDIAFEPDPRCGALPPAPEASLAFFPAPEGGLHRPGVLAAGRALVEAVALMAGAGAVSDADFTFLDAALQSLDGPTSEERSRLWAYVAALYAAPAPGRAVAEALGRLPAGERVSRIRAIRRVFPLEEARTRVCALRLAMVFDSIAAEETV